MKIIAKDAPALVEPLSVLFSVRLFRRNRFCLTEGRIADAEISSELLGSFSCIQSEQLGNEIDHIAVLMAAETIKAVVVNLEAGNAVLMKRTPGKSAAVQLNAVMLSGLFCRDAAFHSTEN